MLFWFYALPWMVLLHMDEASLFYNTVYKYNNSWYDNENIIPQALLTPANRIWLGYIGMAMFVHLSVHHTFRFLAICKPLVGLNSNSADAFIMCLLWTCPSWSWEPESLLFAALGLVTIGDVEAVQTSAGAMHHRCLGHHSAVSLVN